MGNDYRRRHVAGGFSIPVPNLTWFPLTVLVSIILTWFFLDRKGQSFQPVTSARFWYAEGRRKTRGWQILSRIQILSTNRHRPTGDGAPIDRRSSCRTPSHSTDSRHETEEDRRNRCRTRRWEKWQSAVFNLKNRKTLEGHSSQANSHSSDKNEK